MSNQNLKIRLESFNQKSLVHSTQLILDLLSSLENNFSGPIPLPTKIKRYCLLRSPHVDKDSREHFEIRIHRRIIYVAMNLNELTEQLNKLNISTDILISFTNKQ